MKRARYAEVTVRDGRADWMLAKDRQTGETFLVGSCSRELQLRVLDALNRLPLVEPPQRHVIINEGHVKKCLNEPPTTPRPAPPRSQRAR